MLHIVSGFLAFVERVVSYTIKRRFDTRLFGRVVIPRYYAGY